MTTDPTRDDTVRAAIRTQLDATLFVEAGAGTGKTSALVGRILELVCSGAATLGEIGAITFTEAAAAELRDRVYEALERVAAGEGEDHAERRQRAREALGEIDGAAISTLHGFAQRILTAHPFEVGLPPMFDVLDEGRSAVAFDDRWDEFVGRLLDDPSLETPLTRALVCGVTIDHLRAVARECNDNWDLLIDRQLQVRPLGPIEISGVLEPLDAAEAASGCCTEADDLLLDHIGSLAGFRAALHSATTELETLQLLVSAPTLKSAKGRAAGWTCSVTGVRKLLADASQARAALLGQVASDALAALLPAISDMTLGGAEDRRRDGRLEFHDLLVWARQLVRRSASVRTALHREYPRLLIDEFQDTDPIQAELAFRIANGSADPETEDAPWHELPVAPGRLFFVGDPKQAIYRFRRADIGLFLEVRDRHLADRLVLTDNFRSVPGVIEWVNATFGSLFATGEHGVQPAYEGLRARRPADGTGEPPVVLIGGASELSSVNEVRLEEARELVATIQRIRAEGWPVGDERAPARLSDMTVLIPARTGLPTLQDAFDTAGLAYRLESSSLVYESAEVGELMTVLRAIDDPTDQVSVVASLRSALFGCGDDDLAGYHQAGGGWDYQKSRPRSVEASHPVASGMDVLHYFHQQRWWRDVSGLIELVIEQRHLLELGLDERRPRDAWRRLRFVADQARQFTDAYGGDVRRYLAWVELQRRDDVRAVEVVLPEDDDDAVRVMTVHGAKGLEFPIVFLVGLNRTRSAGRSVNVLWGPDGPEIAITKELRTGGHAELAEREETMDRAQDLRLLYVAATRARDHLVVSLHHKAGADCHAARLLDVCGANPGLDRRLQSGVSPAGLPEGDPRVSGRDHDDDGQRQRHDWIVEHQALIESGRRPRTLAATTVAALAREHVDSASGGGPTDGPSAEPGHDSSTRAGSEVDRAGDGADLDLPPWRRGRAGTSIGRAVHGVLQSVDLATGSGVDRLAEVQAVAEGVPGRTAEIVALVREALDSEIVKAAVDGGHYWRELYVGAPAGDLAGHVIEGFIDLLIEGPDGYTVVDYKTDAVRTDEEINAAADRYRLQGATYALAVERALGRRVARCIFLFLRPGGAQAREIPDLDAAVLEVVQVLDWA